MFIHTKKRRCCQIKNERNFIKYKYTDNVFFFFFFDKQYKVYGNKTIFKINNYATVEYLTINVIL